MSVPGWLSEFARRAAAPRPTPAQRAGRAALTLASLGYGAAVGVRNLAYRAGLLPIQRLPCRVICVGNLTVGGTGKTPAVIALARRLAAQGAKPCVLLRGYGRHGSGVAVVSDGRDVLLRWEEAGDEAVLLARRLPGVPIIVGGDRVRAGRLALERFTPDVILLDDGFQHRRLQRDVDLVLLDATDPFGGGRLLPRGRLREPIRELARAHAVLVTRADQVERPEALRERIAGSAPGRPVGWAVHRPCRLRDLAAGQERPLDSLRGRSVFAVSGIANPESFHRTLRQLGAGIAGHRAFPDHHPFSREDRACLQDEARARRAECILTTEKDAVRLGRDVPAGLPVLAVEIELEVVEGAEALAAVLGVSLEQMGRG